MTSIVRFLREVRQEGQKITWPTRKETMVTTIVVFIMVAILATFLFFVDWIISEGLHFVLGLGQ